MKLTVDDSPVVGRKLSPTAQRILAHLLALPDGRLITGRTLCGKINLNNRSLSHYLPEVPETLRERQRFIAGERWLFGNARTIAAYRATLKQ